VSFRPPALAVARSTVAEKSLPQGNGRVVRSKAFRKLSGHKVRKISPRTAFGRNDTKVKLFRNKIMSERYPYRHNLKGYDTFPQGESYNVANI
jgi:hypothetical protein